MLRVSVIRVCEPADGVGRRPEHEAKSGEDSAVIVVALAAVQVEAVRDWRLSCGVVLLLQIFIHPYSPYTEPT